ncbi:hypothetical protein ICL81_07950 [Leucobacter sp. cx-328]|uniref:hypothetical protein n=1 Tax=unclassified Leucobacter TaxID=2621730 RepID=UPI00165DFF2B|nr:MULTISPECIES: hypothetical protein [unclassified Leucobacter]MBC9944440.1 hypothetical protein [Leucobacter sp. cx-328]
MTVPSDVVKRLLQEQEQQLAVELLRNNRLQGYFPPDSEELSMLLGDSRADFADFPRVFLHPRGHKIVGVKVLWPESEEAALSELIDILQLLEDAFSDYEEVHLLAATPWECPRLGRWLKSVPGISLTGIQASLNVTVGADTAGPVPRVPAPAPSPTPLSPEPEPEPDRTESQELVPDKVLPPPHRRKPQSLKDWAVPVCPECEARIELADFVIQPHPGGGQVDCPTSGSFAVIPSGSTKRIKAVCPGCTGATGTNAMTGKIYPHLIPGSPDAPCPWGNYYLEPGPKEIKVHLRKRQSDEPVPAVTASKQKIRPNYADRTVNSVFAYNGGSPGSR